MGTTRKAAEQLLQEAWQEVEANFDDDAAHARFLARCAALGSLDEAGRRYRQVRDRDPARAASATRRLDDVLAAAVTALMSARAPTPRRRPRMFWLVCGVCAGLFGYAILTVLRLLAR
jgi:uncharacterized protein YfiM (DUF2279 family)